MRTATPAGGLTGGEDTARGWSMPAGRWRRHGAPAGACWTTLPFSPHIKTGKISFYYFDPANRAEPCEPDRQLQRLESGRATPCRTHSPGFWQISIRSLAARGAIAINSWWTIPGLHDPENPSRVEDGYGGFSSILEVRR